MLLAVASVVQLPATGAAANPDVAEQAHRDAIRLRPVFPEAWNGLGCARREPRRFDDSVPARLRTLGPNVADRRARARRPRSADP
jgi:hypothetical protein